MCLIYSQVNLKVLILRTRSIATAPISVFSDRMLCDLSRHRLLFVIFDIVLVALVWCSLNNIICLRLPVVKLASLIRFYWGLTLVIRASVKLVKGELGW